ncbi:unnamed protein product [Pylaiella littoralis]
MSAGKREALEVALRRTLGFHLGVDGVDQEEDWELLVCALLDAAEEATLRDGAAGRRSATIMPLGHKQGLICHRYYIFLRCTGGLFPSRDALKYFPLDVSKEDDDDDGGGSGDDVVEPGCCLLCERLMPLTRHHVMPKSTHKRYRKKGYADAVLNRTITICRPCHSAVHRAHDAATLAEHFTTPEQLLADESVGRFVAWARKQRTTSVQDSRNNLLHYRR